MPQLLLVRHAEPSLTGVMLGRLDPPLSEEGHRQAARVMPSLEVETLYASPLRRAVETARYAGRPVLPLEEAAEVGYGDWEGLTWAQIEAASPDLVRAKRADWFAVTPPGGETWEEVALRVRHALERIRLGPFPVAVVGHFGVNAEFARQASGLDPIAFRQGYCEVLTIDL